MGTRRLHVGAYIGAGARDGDRLETLAEAIRLLRRHEVRILRASSLYETEPVDLPGDRTLFNGVLAVSTSLDPRELLRTCLAIERVLGRDRRGRDRSATRPGGPDTGPRPIDLDLLLSGTRVIDIAGLRVPHPRMHERRFVLVPMTEIAPHERHPVLGRDMEELLARCPDTSGVRRVHAASAWCSWDGSGFHYPRDDSVEVDT